MDRFIAINMARQVAEGTPAAHLGRELSELRGRPAFNYNGFLGMLEWQVAIADTLLAGALLAELQAKP